MKGRSKKSAGSLQSGQGMVLAAFLLSGVAGVMHEVVWSRQLVQLIGAAAWAQAVVLAVFMGGLAAGAVLFGRRADRGRPVSLYLWLEIAIALYALAIPLLLRGASGGYVALARHFFERDGARLLLRFALAVVVVAPPAILMGGTLPALARRLVGDVAEVKGRVGALYALNSLGAVLGTAAAGFFALPRLGTWGALVLSAC